MKPVLTIITSLLLILVVLPVTAQNKVKKKEVGKMLGADISFLPQLEANGKHFVDAGVEKDGITLLKDRGFNYIRLRIFNDPASDSGYSPQKGFCDLEHTRQMAMRIKKAGMKFLLDFHYSDTWADPGKQFKPKAWKGLSFPELTEAVRNFTQTVLASLKQQGTLPDMVQVGNEINHGMIWPDGSSRNLDSLADLIKAGITGVTNVDPTMPVMLHIACGGQNQESRWFLDNMLARKVEFDVIGQSYYPRWHGTLDSLKNNLADLATRYKKDIIVVEYSQNKQEVNDIAFNVPGNLGKGTCIWEPFSWGETVVDKEGKNNELMDIYPAISKKYRIKR